MGGRDAAIVAFTVTAGVIVALLFALAAAIEGAQEEALERLEASAPGIKRWGGWILVGVGLWMGAMALFADFFAGLYPV